MNIDDTLALETWAALQHERLARFIAHWRAIVGAEAPAALRPEDWAELFEAFQCELIHGPAEAPCAPPPASRRLH